MLEERSLCVPRGQNLMRPESLSVAERWVGSFSSFDAITNSAVQAGVKEAQPGTVLAIPGWAWSEHEGERAPVYEAVPGESTVRTHSNDAPGVCRNTRGRSQGA
jgi:hypothetical protein